MSVMCIYTYVLRSIWWHVSLLSNEHWTCNTNLILACYHCHCRLRCPSAFQFSLHFSATHIICVHTHLAQLWTMKRCFHDLITVRATNADSMEMSANSNFVLSAIKWIYHNIYIACNVFFPPKFSLRLYPHTHQPLYLFVSFYSK